MTSQQPSEGSRNSGADEPSAVSSENPTEESSKKTESEASAEATGSITPRIYEITDDEGHKLYTMGAIHIADPSILNMPEYFETAFAESDAIAVECNSYDNEFDALSIAELKYSDGTKITDHVSAEDYKKVVSIQCFR